MAYPPEVERWRPLVAEYFRPEDVDKALYVIMHESGGNPSIKAAVPSEDSWGLFQNNRGGGLGKGYSVQQLQDPRINIEIAAKAVYGGSGWKPWGEGALYEGKPFGALGRNPYKPTGNQPYQAPAPSFSKDNLQLTGQVKPGAPAGAATMAPEDPPFYPTESAGTPARWNGQPKDTNLPYGTYLLKPDGSLGEYLGDPRAPSGADSPIRKDIKINQDTGEAFVIDDQGNIVRRIPELDQKPSSDPAASAKGIRINKTTGKAMIVDNQGNLVRYAPEYDEAPEPVKAAPTTKLGQLAADFATAQAALKGGTGTPQAGATTDAGGGSTVAPPAGATAAAAPGATQGIYGVGRGGDTTPVGLRVPTGTPGNGTRDINATNIYQTLGQWAEKPTGDFTKDATTATELQLRQDMLSEVAGGDPLLVSKAMDAMTGSPAVNGVRNSYYPTPQMQQMTQGTVSKSPYDGKGVKLDPSDLAGFEKMDPRDYDQLFGMAGGGGVTAGVEDPDQYKQPVQPAPRELSAQVFPGTSELPIGAIGEDFEGNPLYEAANRNWNGQRGGGRGGFSPGRGWYAENARDPYASGMNRDGTPFRWQGPALPVRRVSTQQMEFASNRNTQIMGRVRQLENMGRWQEADRLRASMFDPYSMESPPDVPGMEYGGGVTAGITGNSILEALKNPIPGYAAGASGMAGVTPAPAGAEFMTEEPLAMVGTNTGDVKAVAGEAGAEHIAITPAPQAPPITDFARTVEFIMGKQGKRRPQPPRPAGSTMMGAASGGY